MKPVPVSPPHCSETTTETTTTLSLVSGSVHSDLMKLFQTHVFYSTLIL